MMAGRVGQTRPNADNLPNAGNPPLDRPSGKARSMGVEVGLGSVGRVSAAELVLELIRN
jgi:hypothetical protein